MCYVITYHGSRTLRVLCRISTAARAAGLISRRCLDSSRSVFQFAVSHWCVRVTVECRLHGMTSIHLRQNRVQADVVSKRKNLCSRCSYSTLLGTVSKAWAVVGENLSKLVKRFEEKILTHAAVLVHDSVTRVSGKDVGFGFRPAI